MKVNWNYPNIIWSGENRIKDLSLACSELSIQKPLFVTDKDLINLKMVKNVINELKNNLNDIKIFSDFSGNPIGENVDDGVKTFNEFSKKVGKVRGTSDFKSRLSKAIRELKKKNIV